MTRHESPHWRTAPGLTPYQTALETMEAHVAAMHANQAEELIWLVEHPPLYTAGTSADKSDLVDPDRFPVYDAGRGGQYTYHGPGQRVAYLMLDLKARKPDIRWFVGRLEEWVIQTLAKFDIQGERKDGRVGIWIDHGDGREEKIAAIGVRVRRWVTFHGIALNLDPDLSHFGGIVPCGISNHGVTSIAALGKTVTMEELDEVLKQTFNDVF